MVLSGLAGWILSLAYPPGDLWWTAPLSLAFLWILARKAGRGESALTGFGFGVGFFLPLLGWVGRFGAPALAGLVLVEAGFFGLFGFLLPFALWEKKTAGATPSPVGAPLRGALLLVATEVFRSHFPWGGFPWGVLAASQVSGPLLAAASQYTREGTAFLLALLGFSAGEGLLAVRSPRSLRTLAPAWAGALATGVLLGLPAALPNQTSPQGAQLRVAAVQSNRFPAGTLPRQEEPAAILKEARALTSALPPGLDMVVWPESTLSSDPRQDPEAREAVMGATAATGAALLVGASEDAGEARWRNVALLYSPSGELLGRYVKMHPVPFGEYIPARPLFGRIPQTRLVPADALPGREPGLFILPGGKPVGVLICFENAFADLGRELVRRGAGVLVVSTNNASFGWSSASRQHLDLSRLLAVETGRWVIHAGVSGISGVVDPEGKVRASLGLFQAGTLLWEVPLLGARTPASRLGSLVGWASVVAAACLSGRGLLAQGLRSKAKRVG